MSLRATVLYLMPTSTLTYSDASDDSECDNIAWWESIAAHMSGEKKLRKIFRKLLYHLVANWWNFLREISLLTRRREMAATVAYLCMHMS